MTRSQVGRIRAAENNAIRAPERTHLRHGHCRGENGGGKSAEYRAWRHMIHRCENPSDQMFARYGGRGITVCKQWRESFIAFLSDVGYRPSPSHSLDRRDSDGNYEPGNVRWATASEQQRNKSTVPTYTVGGITDCVAGWAERLRVRPQTLWKRLKRGWSPERTFAQ